MNKDILEEIARANAFTKRMDKKLSLDETELYVQNYVKDKLLQENYVFDEDELMEYTYLSKDVTGLNVECFADDGGSFKDRNHPLWFLATNGYSKQDDVIPITVTDDIHVDGNYDLKISSEDLQSVFNFIAQYKGAIINLANDKMVNTDFIKYVSNDTNLKMAENKGDRKELLTEMSKLKSSETGLPMDIWVDEGGTYQKSGHSGSPRIKFKSIQGGNKSSEFSTMVLSPNLEIHNLPKNTNLSSKDINELKQFVTIFFDVLIALSEGKVTLEEFKRIMSQCRSMTNENMMLYLNEIGYKIKNNIKLDIL